MKVYIVRHGETEESRGGILTGQHDGVLTERGKGHARKIAKELKNQAFDHIYTSDLKRASDTAIVSPHIIHTHH